MNAAVITVSLIVSLSSFLLEAAMYGASINVRAPIATADRSTRRTRLNRRMSD